MNALIVGKGDMGQAVAHVCSVEGNTTSFFGSKNDRSSFPDQAAKSDVVFLAISTRDEGQAACDYILDAMGVGTPVVLCEKGSMAYHFGQVRPYLDRIGYTASVGGGSGMLSLLSSPNLGLKRIVGIVNGTNNFIFSECARGKDPYKVLAEAQSLKLCEPGNSSLADIVNGELRDIVLKAAILFNCSGVSDQILSAHEFGKVLLFEEAILRELAQGSRRFAVSISREPNLVIRDCLYEPLHVRKGDWHIEVGLAQMSLLPFCPFPKRQQNALVIENAAGLAQIIGVGAGPIPTAAAMLNDAKRLLYAQVC